MLTYTTMNTGDIFLNHFYHKPTRRAYEVNMDSDNLRRAFKEMRFKVIEQYDGGFIAACKFFYVIAPSHLNYLEVVVNKNKGFRLVTHDNLGETLSDLINKATPFIKSANPEFKDFFTPNFILRS